MCNPLTTTQLRALWDEVVLTGLTTYDALNLTPDEQVTEMLETIDMHFEELERLRVIGTPFTDRLRDHLTEEGFTVLSECDDGFTASVSAEGS